MDSWKIQENDSMDNIYSQIIPHIFLPLKLPGNSEDIVREEVCLLSTFQNFLSTQRLGIDILNTVETFKVWKKIQDNQDEVFLSKTIDALKPGQFIVLYIRAQNSGLIIGIPKENDNCCNTCESAILSTFPASQKSVSVNSSPGDLVYTFPTNSIHVPRTELLSSQTMARQLIALNSNFLTDAMSKTKMTDTLFDEDRDVPDPKFVAKWIRGSLCSQDSCLCYKFPQIVKKVRDEVVVAERQEMPFRRSGLWMTLKAALQLLLISELGPSAGKHLYKIILLKFMCTFCSRKGIEADVGVQIMAKIARRYYKLSKIQDFTHKELLVELEDIVGRSVNVLRSRLYEKWNAEIKIDASMNKLNLSGSFNFQEDTMHPLKEARKELDARDAAYELKTLNSSVPVPVGPPRDRSTMQLTNPRYLAANDEEAIGVALYDFERNVMHWDKFVQLDDCAKIRELFIAYHSKASEYYKMDPIGISRMTLTCLKMIQIVDEMVCKHYPLLKQHRHGVPIEIVQHLMLPFHMDMQLANSLETYFHMRKSGAKYPGLLEEQSPSKDSYSVRHAMSDEEMKNKLKEILAIGEERARSKREEVEDEKEEWYKMQKKISGMSCCRKWEEYRKIWVHPLSCSKCALQDKADNMSVSVYMYPLPDILEAQNAIVFELLNPKPIACLRDILTVFLKKLKLLCKGEKRKTMWAEHEQLRSHCERDSNWLLNLGSEHLPVGKSHFRTLHPNKPKSQFVVENDCGTGFCLNELFITTSNNIPKEVLHKFVFQVEGNSPYAKLQWTLNDHDYAFSQNEILARQNECPANLKLMEFKEFGTMRAGHRIQLRNLYRALRQETLSLRTKSVFNLICQVLWRAGPNSVPSSVVRESHEDLQCKEFLEELLSLLESMIGGLAENWNDNRSLASCIIILLRLFSISQDESILEICFNLIRKCRKIVLQWCKDIENILGKMGDSAVDEQNKFRRKLVDVASCCSLTYWVDLPDSKKYLADDAITWLQSVKTIQDNIIMNPKAVANLPVLLRNQLRRVRECGIANEEYFHELLTDGTVTLNDFIKIAWAGAGSTQEISDMTWRCCDEIYSQIYEAKLEINGSTTVFHVDLISGIFQVNGKPVGLLPRGILIHADYSRVFNEYVFEVQSVTESPWTVISKYDYRGSKIEFMMKGGMFFITEICPDKVTRYEYVPNTIFSKELPYDLIHNYTHWWNKRDKHIIFRPLDSKENLEVYCLDLDTGLIVENATGRLVVNISSKSYAAVVCIFKRLEHENHIAIFTPKLDKNCNEERLEIVLSQMRLNFTVTANSIEHTLKVSSLEFPGMNVAEIQKCGTLVGLTSGLMLEPKEDYHGRKVILIPHGDLNFSVNLIVVDTKSLKTPRYFAYEVDERLQQLKSGQTKGASAYLAYLHAVTSHPLPDPLTGHTGTERALQLLQSGHCWSCESFDAETTATLKHIAKLSPKRTFYSKTKRMTKVSWPSHLNSVCCSDAYQIVVKKLLEDSNRLAFLFPRNPFRKESKRQSESDEDLCRKSYWRYFKCTTEQAQIAEDFLKLEYPAVSNLEQFNFHFSAENTKAMLKVACLCNQWKHSANKRSCLHNSLISDKSKLRGCTQNGFPYEDTFVAWMLEDIKDFWNFWLDLYELARKVELRGLRKEWTLILSYYAFTGVPEQHLMLLMSVAVNYESFSCEEMNPPSYDEYENPCRNDFDSSDILTTIKQCNSVTFEAYLRQREHLRNRSNESPYQFEEKMRTKYNGSLGLQAWNLTQHLSKGWPSPSCNATVSTFPWDSENLLDINAVIQKVNPLLKNWYHNYELKQFITEVENRVINLEGPQYCGKSLSKRLRESVEVPFEDVPAKTCKLNEVDCPCNFRAYSDAETIFLKGNIDTLNPTDMDNFRNEDSGFIASDDTADMLSDPVVTVAGEASCKIWEQLVSSLQVSESERQTMPKKSRALKYEKNNFEKSSDNFKQRSAACKIKSLEFLELATSPIMENSVFKILIDAGIFPRITPVTLLPLICCKADENCSFQNCLRNAVGAYAVIETLDQHALRCRRYAESVSTQVELQRELDNEPHENWSPSDRPEWLLFEIEADLLVRSVQKQVAELMENPKGAKNAVMQLNMGEGKTTVITPLLLLRLANKKQLCRLTVLRSLFNTNVQALQVNLGGLLLNRRIYSFPCRRDYAIDCNGVKELFKVYKECCDKGGINVSTPEYRLSFQLKAYEQCRNESLDIAELFLQIQQWLNETSRDILDESDEIMHVKYQLIYALGIPQKLNGDALRWTVLQSLLHEIPEVIRTIRDRFGIGTVEIACDVDVPRGVFRPCRLLKAESYRVFCELLADKIIAGTVSSIVFPGLVLRQKELLKKFFTEEIIEESILEEVNEFLDSDDICKFQHTALILRGLMACGVLFATFNKRWRVNYGVNPVGTQPLAVPFRAKDVAAERTEFGHPDVALVLTHLSYYYSGLKDSQLDECFARIYREPDPEMVYDQWISTVEKPDPTIRSLKGINLSNNQQKIKILYPTLSKNKTVIDYWLGKVILPIKARQFPSKMICSAWDLASDRTNKSTTGFSGTNDSQLLLPLTISQRDMPELKWTNYQVFQNLLLEENNSYLNLEPRITAKEILQKLVKEKIPLLLDVGALMLELNNEEVAYEWLQLTDKEVTDAAIYFNADNRLMVKDRSVLSCVPFEISPYRNRLDKCVIYLDDIHTRGTDLKIPSGTRGCVTLGKGVSKDKLVQGCMRMRKLGKGHTVCFWASDEVHNEILHLIGERATYGSAHVLNWALNNSRNAIKEGFPHWVAAACNYIRNNRAQEVYGCSSKDNDDREHLFEQVSQDEILELEEIYGRPWKADTFSHIAEEQLKAEEARAHGVVSGYRAAIVEHCKTYVPNLTKNVHLLDEEQERELELEIESECEISRPDSQKPYPPQLHEDILRTLRNTDNFTQDDLSDWAMRLPEGLRSTSLVEHNELDAWGNNIFITRDFFNTIVTNVRRWLLNDTTDSFLRPVNWIVAFTLCGSPCWLLMSPYEVNMLIPEFRNKRLQASLHMYSARLAPGQSTLSEIDNLVLPSGARASLVNVPRYHDLNASLFIFAGCAFFGGLEEMTSFCNITGFAPNPRTAEEEQAFENQLMDRIGFLLPSDIRDTLRPGCRFNENPGKLVEGIIVLRSYQLSTYCHVSKIIHESSKPSFD